MSATIYDALRVLTPNARFGIKDNDYNQIDWHTPEIPLPTKEQVDAEIYRQNSQIPLDECKAQAKKLLADTDWSEIPSVSDPANTPHLVNQADFISYRNAVRLLAVNPVVNPSFPPVPVAQWG